MSNDRRGCRRFVPSLLSFRFTTLAPMIVLVGLGAGTHPAAGQCPTQSFPMSNGGAASCASGACSIPLAWEPVPGATQSTRYLVYVNVLSPQESRYCGAIGTFQMLATVSTPAYQLTGIPQGSVLIWTVDVQGCPDNPNQWYWVRDLLTVTPSVPVLSGSLDGTGHPALRFTPPDANTFSHTLQRSADGSSWTDVADWVMSGDLNTGITVGGYCPVGMPLSFVDEEVSSGTRFYRLETVGSFAGGGGHSNVVQLTAGATPQITSFTASPQAIALGQSSQLSWASTGGITASIDHGVGTVPTSGSVTVTPQATTTYTLTVTGAGGSATSQATVTVAEQGLSLSPSELTLVPGGTGTVTATLSPVRPAPTALSLTSSNTSVASVPASLTIAAGVASGTFTVSGVGIGSAQVRAALPPELGGGSVAMAVSVLCAGPAGPVATGPSGSLSTGSVFNLGWTDVLGSDTAGSYEAQLSADSGFSRVDQQQKVTGRSAAFTVPSGAGSAVYARVRGIAGCGTAGAFSNVVTVPVAKAPAVVILTQGQTPAWSVTKGAALGPATLRFRNVGETAAGVSFTTSSGSTFFSLSPSSATLGAGDEVVVTLTGAAGATSRTGLLQGAVAAAWSGGVATASVTLTVAESAADVVPDVDRDYVYNLATGGGVTTQTIQVTNPSDVSITLGSSIGPGGAWLSVEPADLADPLGARQTRSVRLRIDRSRRTAADGEPPVFTLLTLTSVGASTGRLIRVYDSEPPAVSETTTRLPSQSATRTFIIPTAVHAAGAQSALFTSDGWIRNLSGNPITVELLASPRDGGASLKAEKTLPGLSLVRLYDFVQGVFGRTDLAANVEIRPKTLSDATQLVVRITTEGQPAGGQSKQRYSSEIPVYASGTGTGVGQPALVMPGIDVTDNVRTNVILSETAGVGTSVTMKLYGADGTLLGQSSAPEYVGPYGITQNSVQGFVGLAGGVTVRGGSLRIEGASGAGRVVALGTAIDNVSQSFRAVSVETEKTVASAAKGELSAVEVKPVVVPSIVHQTGINAFFTTRLEVRNETGSPAALTFVYTYTGQDDKGNAVSDVASVQRTIGARQSLAYEEGQDAVVNLMKLPASWNTNGPLRVEGAGIAQVLVKSWVQTPSDVAKPQENLKYAEFRAFQSASPEVVGVGGSTVALSSGVSKMTGQRTNLILTEVAGQGAQVRVKLVDGATGQPIGQSDTITLGAYQKVQINNGELWPMLKLPDGERDRMQMVLEAVGTGAGRVAGMLTQIDSASNATLVTPFAPAGPQSPGIGVGR